MYLPSFSCGKCVLARVLDVARDGRNLWVGEEEGEGGGSE